MFLFFPISTDAPVYHWPYATVGLIIANVLVYVAMVPAMVSGTPIDEVYSGWVLMHGSGLYPSEWLMSMFAHADPGHLIGNMVFLWVFGLVVEGKLGSLRFLACYLCIGLLQSGLEQSLMLGSTPGPGSLGASSAIYGIMAMAAVWAPKNEITFAYTFTFIYNGTFDIAIGWLAGIYIGLDLFWVLITIGDVSSSWLHVTGAMIGFPLGIVLLKRGIVDCEGWDMFHVWQGDLGAVREREAAQTKREVERTERQVKKTAELATGAKKQIRQFLIEKNPIAAYALYCKVNANLAESGGEEIELTTDELQALITGLHFAKQYENSAPLMAQLIERATPQTDAVRIKLAQICVVQLDRPGRALELIAAVDTSKLATAHQKLVKKIEQKAQQMQAEGVVELDDDGW